MQLALFCQGRVVAAFVFCQSPVLGVGQFWQQVPFRIFKVLFVLKVFCTYTFKTLISQYVPGVKIEILGFFGTKRSRLILKCENMAK